MRCLLLSFLLLPGLLRAQCDGTEVIVHTFSGIAAWELEWSLVDGNGDVLADYAWTDNLVTTADTVCVTTDCATLVAESDGGDGWWITASVEIEVNGVLQDIAFTEGELGFFPVAGMPAECTDQLTGCLDPDAVNFTPGAVTDDGSCDYLSVFEWEGQDREYILHLPPGLGPGAPLLFCLHGLSGTAEGMRRATRLHHIADTAGFGVVWPQGEIWNWDGALLPYWNANLFLTPDDDIGFLTALAEHLQAEHGFDPGCTYASGASNGGMMSYTLVCERPDVWRAMGTVGGVMSAHEQDNGTVGPPRPVFHLHGTMDFAMPYSAYEGGGGPWTGGWGVWEMMEFWASEHGHTAVDSVVWADEIPMPEDTLTETRFTWSGGPGGPVVHHRVENGGHDWWGDYGDPSEVDASALLWDFFRGVCATSTGLTESSPAPAWTVAPNPAAGAVRLGHLPAGTPCTLRDALGRTLHRATPDATGWLSLDGVPPGLHWLTPDGHPTRRLVVR